MTTQQEQTATATLDDLSVLADLDFGETIEETIEAEAEAPALEAIEEVVEEQVEDELAELDGLDDLDLGIETVTAAPPPEIDAEEALDEDALRDLDVQITRHEAYEAQEADEVATTSAEETAPDPAAAPKARAPRAAAGPRGPKVQRDLASLPAAVFVTSTDIDPATTDAGDLEQDKQALIAKRPTQVKIAEKFDNLFVQLAAGKAPSTYVMQAFALLDKQGSASSADLIAGFKAAGLGDGTARSQTGQIMALFAATDIATRTNQTLTLNAKSAIAEKLRKLAA